MKASLLTVGLLVCLTQQVRAASLPSSDANNTITMIVTAPPPVTVVGVPVPQPAGMCWKDTEGNGGCAHCSFLETEILSCECNDDQCAIDDGLPTCSDKCGEHEMEFIMELYEKINSKTLQPSL